MTRSIIVAIAAALGGCHASQASPAGQTAEAEVRARERAWLDAYEQRDPVVMADVLAEGFLITFPDGGRMDRDAVVESASRSRPPDDHPPRFSTIGTVARMRDGVVVLIGQVIEARTDPQGQRRENASTYTDTWVREGAKWRVLSSHLSRAKDRRE